MNHGTGQSTDDNVNHPDTEVGDLAPGSLTANELTAVAASQAIANGRLSAEALLESCLDQIDRVDPSVNALVVRATDRARSEAQRADEMVAAGEPLGPLHGLPVAIKDLQATEGIPTTLGSQDFAEHIPSADAGIVARIRAAGGIIVAKSNIPERSIGANTVNRLFGATGNPFDATKTCGGSSGGSAVALATDMVPLATGSDHGGSVRIPACYCGVVGHRATPGVVPFEERAIPQTFYSVQGPMGRTVADAALLLSVIADRDLGPLEANGIRLRDPMAFPLDAAVFRNLEPVDLSQLRVGFSEDLGGVLVSASVRDSFRDRIETLSGLVNICEPLALDLTEASDLDWKLRADVFVAQYYEEAATWDDRFNPNIRATYDAALGTPMELIARARRSQMKLFQRMAAVFDEFDLVVCPGVSVPPFLWAELYPRSVDDHPVENYMAWLALSSSLTVVGHPVTALPAGKDDTGMPFGLQLVGPAYGDRRLLSQASAIESAFDKTGNAARPRPDIAKLLSIKVDLGQPGREVY